MKVQATGTTDIVPTAVVLPDDGTSDTLYITSSSQLAGIGTSDYEKFVLKNDIEISEKWDPINNFTGIFDGNGHSITFNIDETTGPIPNTQYLGLFASCTNVTIKNLYVNGNISLNTGGSVLNPNIFVGGIAGSLTNSTLENVHFSGNINVVTNNDNSSWVGGLVGKATNTQISLSSNTAPITSKVDSVIGATKVGGLCGEFSGTIENCYNMGNVVATAKTESPYAGGIVGNNKGSVTKSYNSGKVQSEGSGMSFSDVYAGGIAAVGETGSSVTDCAVMSPEISVTIGWINSGYKYIIANGGNKSNNISINDITGSPTNDSNFRYTQAELKTTIPYQSFDFNNTWAIDETINNGYPFLDRNIYAISLQYENVPYYFKSFIDNNYITINDLKQTSDGFTLCTKPLDQILASIGISDEEVNGEENEKFGFATLDDWYIFNIGMSYGLLKMRVEFNEEWIGTSIPFMDFDITLINLLHEDLIQQVENSIYEVQLFNELDRLTNGIVPSDYSYSVPMIHYFDRKESKASHLIAEEYIRKVIFVERNSGGYVKVPNKISDEQRLFLLMHPDIYDEENNRIEVPKYNLSNTEKCAILVCRTGNQSLNSYAAENLLHAKYTRYIGNFLQGNDDVLNINGIILDRVSAALKYPAAIKADAGVGEEFFSKEKWPISSTADSLKEIFGDV